MAENLFPIKARQKDVDLQKILKFNSVQVFKMGLFISKLMNAVGSWTETPARVIMVGLDAAGKTTVMILTKFLILFIIFCFLFFEPSLSSI